MTSEHEPPMTSEQVAELTEWMHEQDRATVRREGLSPRNLRRMLVKARSGDAFAIELLGIHHRRDRGGRRVW